MCGLAGIAFSSVAERPARDVLERMIRVLAHRGPDGFGFHVDAGIGLAHARLAIIDLATGAQPLCNEDGSIWVVLNGEIFNYIELRTQLRRDGHSFRTESDTEVIVHLYEEYGDDFVQHLNGQFAIALWDAPRHRLVLARDRTGIRPLFYHQNSKRLAFASEVKSLLTLADMPRALDPQALAQIFTFWAPLGSRSVFAGIEQLAPGHLLTLENGRTQIRKYWDWDFPAAAELAPDGTITSRVTAASSNIESCAAQLRELLIDAVRLQLRADVPVGAYLSGGLDSSIIVSLIRNFTDTPLRTFSLTFADAEFDESAQQQQLVNYLHTEHTALRCDRGDIARIFPRTIWHTETPIVRTAPAPLMLLSQKVRECGFKVVLTGEGADEVFGGYDLFKEAKIRRFMASQPASTLRPRILQRLYPYLRNSPAASHGFAQRFFSEGREHLNEPFFAHIPRWTTTGRIAQFFSSELRAAVGTWNPYAAVADLLPAHINGWSPLARDQYVEAHTLMSGYLLNSQGDRMAMANSIEGRFPFLDHRVIEFANRLPPSYKLRGLTEKYLLKRSVQGLLPESLRQRTKQPYRAPDIASFIHNGRAVDYVAELLSESSLRNAGYFDPAAVGKLLAKSCAGRAIGFGDNMAFTGILSTMLVHEQFIRHNVSVPFTAHA